MSNNGKQGVINGATKVLGIFGDPVEHTLSPAMHNAAFRERGLNFCYLPFRVSRADLASAIKAVRALGLRGINVTAPHKEAVVPWLDELSPEAGFLQAVNTIQHKNGKLIGHNTDVDGFLYLLENNLKNSQKARPAGKTCLLGAGGAARAVCLALSRAGVEQLVIANRTPARAEALASLLIKGGIFKDEMVSVIEWNKKSLRESLTGATLIINSLSEDPVRLGLLPRECPGAPGCMAAIDLRYGSSQTSFQKWADDNGILFLDGLGMLLGQGLKAFELFTGEKAPLQTMRKALLQKVGR